MILLRRVVFDTSTLVGAALRIGSVPHQALKAALASGSLCASSATLDELQRVLRREKFDRYQPVATRREFFDIVAQAARIFEVPLESAERLQPSCRDPEDDKFLALAAVCQADVVVASDADLLVLNPWHGIPIVRPADFLTSHP